MKLLLKNWAYRTGLLGAYHRLRNRKQLTVVMFHRVLPVSDPRHAGADPEWTMTPACFSECLRFFRKHYHVVTPEQVCAALRGEMRLPSCSLLITFDDGWADTAEYAQPLLDKHGMQALIFVAGSAINQLEPFWEEQLYRILSTRPDGLAQLVSAITQQGISIPEPSFPNMDEASIRAVIRHINQIKELDRREICNALREAPEHPASMLSAKQLAQLNASRHTIGGHGMTHQPLTSVADLDNELKSAQETISTYAEKKLIDAMSFPHGDYSESVIAKCRSAGFRHLFSSDAHLNLLKPKLEVTQPVGRIHISERAITDLSARFQPALLATWLFLRPMRFLN